MLEMNDNVFVSCLSRDQSENLQIMDKLVL